MTRPLLLAALLVPTISPAQADDERRVLQVIDHFFAAMTARDTVAMARVLTAEGTLHAVRPERDAHPVAMSHASYLANLAQGTERLLERIWDPVVQMNGPVASITAPYDFHVDGAFSHCGTDIFTLVRTGDTEWRISGGVFTMLKEGCPASPLGPVK